MKYVLKRYEIKVVSATASNHLEGDETIAAVADDGARLLAMHPFDYYNNRMSLKYS